MNLEISEYEKLGMEIDRMLATHKYSEKPQVITPAESFGLVINSLRTAAPATQLPGWKKFNEFTGGFRGKEFTILCGSTGSGETEFLANISARLMFANTPHVVWSVETGAVDFAKRVISSLYGKDLNLVERMSEQELLALEEDQGQFYKSGTLSLFKYENRIPSKTLLCDLLYAHKKLGAQVAMIDNLNFFLDVTTSAEQIVEMDRVIHDIIIFCKQVDMHVIMVMHPKKTDHGRVESEFDIKGSSTAVQEAHNVILFNRPTIDMLKENVITKDCRELTFAKLRRRGSHVGKKIWFERDRCQYNEVAT